MLFTFTPRDCEGKIVCNPTPAYIPGPAEHILFYDLCSKTHIGA
jgi:hypothetical protein